MVLKTVCSETFVILAEIYPYNSVFTAREDTAFRVSNFFNKALRQIFLRNLVNIQHN